MASQVPTSVPQGRVVSIGIPDSEDIPRLVFTAPYFTQVPLAELIEPSVIEAVNAVLPSLVPPYVDGAVQAAVQEQAVLLVGSTMTGPLFLNPVMPSADAQAASKAYVDTMLSTAGIPEVPPVPVGQTWARETGQWVPISESGGTFLPIAGGSMQGNINMSGNTITNMAAVPAMPNGAAPAQWVLNQIASVSLYQGTWDADTNVPDLTQLSTHVNAYTWIALTTSPSGVVIGPAIPGLQGTTVFNGDTVIYSTVQGGFKSIHSGGITLPEADGRYVQLAGSQMSGALLLNANATQNMQAVTFQQLEAAVANTVTPDAPADGQAYLRVGIGTNRWVPGLPLAGGILTGALTLSGNATQNLNAVPLQQVNSLITAGTTGFLPLSGGQMTGLLQLSGNATVNLNPVPLQQLNAMLGTYAPIQNPVFTGTVTLPGNAASALQAVPLQQLTSQLAGYLPLTGGTLSGPLTVGGNGILYPPSTNHIAFSWSGTQLSVIVDGTTTSPLASNAQLAGYLPLTGGTVTGNLTTNGTLTAAATFVANGAANFNGVASFAPAITVGGNGIAYNAFGTNHFAFGWSGSAVAVYVDGSNVGNIQMQASDQALKENFAPIAVDCLATLDKVQLQQFDWIPNPVFSPPRPHWSCGFTAQDIQTLVPEAVSGTAGNLGIDLMLLMAYCVGAIQQLSARVGALDGKTA